MTEQLYQDYLTLVGDVTLVYNKNNNKIIYAYDKGKITDKDIDLAQYSNNLKSKLGIENQLFQEDFCEWLLGNEKESFIFVGQINSDKSKFACKKINSGDYILGIIENLEDKKNAYDLVDSLTGVSQKASFEYFVKQEIQKENPRPFYMVSIDIDNFKTINDTYGHKFGDLVLKVASGIILKYFKNGKVGRMGGDEFSAISFDSNEYNDIWKKLHDMCIEINKASKSISCSQTLSFSVGCVRYGVDGTDYETLYLKADKALYRGKKKGKNCFIIYDDEKHKDIHVDSMKRYFDRIDTNGFNFVDYISLLCDIISENTNDESIINQILQTIGNFFYADRIVLSLKENEEEVLYKAWTDEKYKDAYNVFERSDIHIWDEHTEDGFVRMKSVKTIERLNPELHSFLLPQGVKSVVRFSLGSKDKILGYLRIDSFSERFWPVEDLYIHRITNKIISLYLNKVTQRSKAYSYDYDKLTGALTYNKFIEESKKMFPLKQKMVLFYMNFDKFKYINEFYSFKAGDKTLIETAKILKGIFTEDNTLISRFAGDRFMIFTPFESYEKIENQFKKFIIGKDLIEYEGESLHDHIHVVTGVYVTTSDDHEITTIIDAANLARKSIVDVNRTSYSIYNMNMKRQRDKELILEGRFYEALKNNEFEIYLQPKIHMTTSKLIGCEALTRWNYKFETLYQPNDYVPLFERKGIIGRLDYYVFENICKYLKDLLTRGISLVTISINLSRCHLNFDYPNKIEEIRKKYDVDPSLIEIEITESLISENPDMVVSIMRKLHELGYKISMDDFGSGYSNLALLSKFNFDYIKIDKSICLSIADKKTEQIIKAIKNLCENLGVDVICEGVENKMQKEILVSLGLYNAQGYYYDKPLKIDEFENKYLK